MINKNKNNDKNNDKNKKDNLKAQGIFEFLLISLIVGVISSAILVPHYTELNNMMANYAPQKNPAIPPRNETLATAIVKSHIGSAATTS